MVNKLCEPTCFGFTAEGASGEPTFPVICKGSELVVRAPTTSGVWRQGTQQAFNIGIASGQTIPGASMTPSFANPFGVAASIIVNHEFGMSGGFAEADYWDMYGDISISGGTLVSGGTTGQFQIEGNDGRNFANDNRINSRYILRSYTMAYSVPAFGTATIGMLTRLEARDIRGGFRSLGNLVTSMTVHLTPRYT